MNILQTESFNKISKSKYPKSETEPYNPWAVCNKSTGGKKKDPEKFERCVHHLKDQNKKKDKKEAGIDDVKDVAGLTRKLRTNKVSPVEFQRKLDNEFSGKADEERGNELDDVWLDKLRSLRRNKERRNNLVLTFVVEKKNK